MKTSIKNIIMIILIFSISSIIYSQEINKSKKTTIALIDLSVNKELSKGLSSVLSDVIRQEIVLSEDYEILDRKNMEMILKEQNFIISDNCNGKECIVQVGQLLGVEKMLFGNVGMLGKRIIITLQMVDISTGKIEKLEKESYVGAIEDLEEPVIRLVHKIIGTQTIQNEEYALYVTSEPEGANVYIDEKQYGTTPVTIKLKSDKKVYIKVIATGYQVWFQDIKPKKGETVIVSAKLIYGDNSGSISNRFFKKYMFNTGIMLGGIMTPWGFDKNEGGPGYNLEVFINYRPHNNYEFGFLLSKSYLAAQIRPLGLNGDEIIIENDINILSQIINAKYYLNKSDYFENYITGGLGIIEWTNNISLWDEYDASNLPEPLDNYKSGNSFCCFVGYGFKLYRMNLQCNYIRKKSNLKRASIIELNIGIDIARF